MKISVKIMKPTAYAKLQNNCNAVLQKIKEHPDSSSWLGDYIGYDPYVTVDCDEIDDFSLKYDKNDYKKYEKENAVILYEHLNMLPSHILYSQYFWAWINFEKAYRQAQQTIDNMNVKTLQNSWFSKVNNRREIMLGAMAREFIKVKLTVDEKREDKYELTQYLLDNKTLYIMLMARNVSDSPNVSHAVMRVVKMIKDSKDVTLSRDQDNELLKIAFKIGSVMLIDDLTCDEITDILVTKFSKLYPKLF